MVKCVMDISATRYNKTINIIFAFCVSALILQVTYYILQFPFFVFSDDVEFVDFLLYRTNFPWCILPSSGRFFPFARLEYFPILVTDFSVSAKMQFMFALNAIKFSVFILVTYKILRQIIDQYLSAILVFVFMGICLYYGIFPMLLTTIYPEFTLVIILALFIFLYINALNSDSNCIHYSLMTILMCKNTTQELISYIENSKKSGYDILFYIPDDISLKNTKDTSVTHWKFIVLKKIYALYSTNKKYEIKRIKDMDEVNKELNNSNMVIFADEIEIKQEPYNKLITLDYIFVNAVIKDNNDNIKKEYCDFIKKIKDKRLYNKDSKKLFTSAQNYCDSR